MFGKEKNSGDQPLNEEQPLRMDPAGGRRDTSKAALLVAVLAVVLTVVLFLTSKSGDGIGEEQLNAIKAELSQQVAAQETRLAALETKLGAVDVAAQMRAEVIKQRLEGMARNAEALKSHLAGAGADPKEVEDKVGQIKALLDQLGKYGGQ